jgi:hypothetical protein
MWARIVSSMAAGRVLARVVAARVVVGVVVLGMGVPWEYVRYLFNGNIGGIRPEGKGNLLIRNN